MIVIPLSYMLFVTTQRCILNAFIEQIDGAMSMITQEKT